MRRLLIAALALLAPRVALAQNVPTPAPVVMPSATTGQLYGGTGTPGVAAPVTLGGGCTLTGGVLSCTGGGGSGLTIGTAAGTARDAAAAIAAETAAQSAAAAAQTTANSAAIVSVPGGTSTRTPSQIAADEINVLFHGVQGDGSTDDTVAINATVALWKTAVLSGSCATLKFPAGHAYVIAATSGSGSPGPTQTGVNFTGVQTGYGCGVIDWSGASFICKNGSVCIDASGTDHTHFRGGYITSGATIGNAAESTIGFLQDRTALNTSDCAENVFDNVQVIGNFSQHAFASNSCETQTFDHLKVVNTDTGASDAFVADCTNYLNFTSPNVTRTWTTNAAESCNENTFITPVFVSFGTKAPVWLNGTRRWNFIGGYELVQGTATAGVTLFDTGAQYEQQLQFSIHVEGPSTLANVFQFAGANATPNLAGFEYQDHNPEINASGSIFALTSGVTSATIEVLHEINVNNLTSGAKWWDNSANYAVHGTLKSHDGSATYPGTYDGMFCSPACVPTYAPPGLLATTGVTANALGANGGDGVFYGGQALPTLTVAPPLPGGTTATAHVVQFTRNGAPSAVVSDAGSHTNGDIVTASGETCSVPDQLTLTVSGGLATSWALVGTPKCSVTAGAGTAPASGDQVTFTGGTGGALVLSGGSWKVLPADVVVNTQGAKYPAQATAASSAGCGGGGGCSALFSIPLLAPTAGQVGVSDGVEYVPTASSSLTRAATGSVVSRTLGAAAADVFNVRNYGALGTGSSATIGTTYGASLAALAAYTTPAGATPFAWATNSIYGLTFTLNTSVAQGSAGTGLTFLSSLTVGGATLSLASWIIPANGQDLMQTGMQVSGSCIPAGTTVSAIPTATQTNSAGGTTANTTAVPTGAITLSQSTSSACASGTAITFTISPTQLAALTQDWLGMQAAVAAAYSAGGGQVVIPAGSYSKTREVVVPTGTNPNTAAQIEIVGAGMWNTKITDTVDTGPFSCSIGEMSRGTGSTGRFRIRDVTLQGPGANNSVGNFVAGFDGVCIGSEGETYRIRSQGYHAGVDVLEDHGKIFESDLGNNFYGIYMAPNGDVYGNLTVTNQGATGEGWASVGVAWNNTLDSSSWYGFYFGLSPYGLYRELPPSGQSIGGNGFLTNLYMSNVFTEQLGNGWIYDENGVHTIENSTFIAITPDVTGGGSFQIPGRGLKAVIYTPGDVFNSRFIGVDFAHGANPSVVSDGLIEATAEIQANRFDDMADAILNNSKPILVSSTVLFDYFTMDRAQGEFRKADGALSAGEVVAHDIYNPYGGGARPMVAGATPIGVVAQTQANGAIVPIITFGNAPTTKTTDVGMAVGDAVCISRVTPTSITDCATNALGQPLLGADTDPGAVAAATTSANIYVQIGPPLPVAASTVATLPTCNAANKGGAALVTDATSPTYNGTLTGGGSVYAGALCNGSAWTAH